MLQKLLITILRVLIGALFIFSAYSKIYPIEPFEFTFVDMGIANWKLAPILARLFISIEFFLGILFLLNIKIKIASKISFIVLTLFSIYLFGLILNDNNGNCGCFGEYIVMTPLEALIKNLLMFIIIWFVYKYQTEFNFWGKSKYIYYLTIVISIIAPHILNYVDYNHSQAYLTNNENQYIIPLDSLYNNERINNIPRLDFEKVEFPIKNLSNGKHILAFMSLTCKHCKIAAKKMRLIKERNPNISMYLVLNGDDNKLQPFFDETKATNIPYTILLGRNFVYLSGVNLPAIFLINNGIVENKINYLKLDQEEIEKWLNS